MHSVVCSCFLSAISCWKTRFQAFYTLMQSGLKLNSRPNELLPVNLLTRLQQLSYTYWYPGTFHVPLSFIAHLHFTFHISTTSCFLAVNYQYKNNFLSTTRYFEMVLLSCAFSRRFVSYSLLHFHSFMQTSFGNANVS